MNELELFRVFQRIKELPLQAAKKKTNRMNMQTQMQHIAIINTVIAAASMLLVSMLTSHSSCIC